MDQYDASDFPDNLGLAELEKVFESIVYTVERGRQEIYEIANDARKEYERLAAETWEIKNETTSIISQVDCYEKEEKSARIRLMEVSRNFYAFDEEDIKTAYDEARELQVKVSVLREKEKQMLVRRDELERSLKRMEVVFNRAEGLVEKVNMVLRMLKGNMEAFSIKLEKANKHQRLGMWLAQAQEEERRKIARELHDGPAQGLANLVMRIELIEKLWDRDQVRAREEMGVLRELIRENIADVRRVIFDLRPMALDDLGLVPALKRYLVDYQDKYNFETEFLFFGEERRLPLPVEVALFRMVQEAVNNTRKHGQTSSVTVKLEIAENHITSVIKDRGCGFDTAIIKNGNASYGLMGMKERVSLLGGEFTIKSKPGRGTSVIIHLPLVQEGDKP
ncbi:MAG: sensor histidine kinase [Chitinophagales bacterium]